MHPKILNIKSKKSELNRVEEFLRDIFIEYNIPSDKFNKVYLCVTEAVLNAIEHGNKNNCDKTVSIGVHCLIKKLDVTVEDEGEGFDFELVDDPTKKENIMKESGRGIHIIRCLSDKIEFNKKGNGVQFKIECT